MSGKLGAVWIAVVLLASYCVYDFLSSDGKPVKEQQLKVGYIQINQVFEEFDMKKDMVEKLKLETKAKRDLVDSLAVGVQLLSDEISNSDEPTEAMESALQYKRVQYFNHRQEYENMMQEKTQQYDQEIVGRLNNLVKDYAKKNKYDFIYGADGSGFLMYGSKGHDVTEQVIQYLNKIYQGN